MAKEKPIEKIDVKELNKKLGQYTFKKAERNEDGTLRTPRYKSGIVLFDMLLNGGLPKGKILALGSEPGIGKTTLLAHVCANVAENNPDKRVYYIDVEGGASYELWNDMGFSDLLYDPKENPDGNVYVMDSAKSIQAIARICKVVLEDPDTALIVIDSDTAVTDETLLEQEDLGTSKNAVGANARLWSAAIRPINALVTASNACMVIVHQARVDISGWMPVVESAGGNAVKHVASVEIWGKRKGFIAADNTITKKKDEAVGALMQLQTKKNRLTKPFAAVTIPIMFGRGVSNKWAYKLWLENHGVEDTTTGEVTPYINWGKSGYGVFSLGQAFTPIKFRGDAECWELIEKYYDQVVSLVDASGGFTLEKPESDASEE